jgi:hypothetical protein
MAVVAAYLGKVQLAPDSAGSAGTYATIGGASPGAATGGVTKADLSTKVDLVDTTPLGGVGAHQRYATLVDATVTISAPLNTADAAQSNLIQAYAGTARGVQVWIKFFVNATNTWTGAYLLSDLKIGADAAGVPTLDVTLVGNGLQVFA